MKTSRYLENDVTFEAAQRIAGYAGPQSLTQSLHLQASTMISIGLVAICIFLTRSVSQAEDLATAVAAGKVNVSFQGTGGSSGDSIRVIVTKTDKSGENLALTIPAGTRLKSGNPSAQSMVIAAVKGQVMGENSYSPSSVIEVGDTPTTYVLEAFCLEFEKDNPSSATRFSFEPFDPVLACILNEASQLSTQAKQAAVWIYTEKASFSHVNAKFYVSRSDWDAAAAVVSRCSSNEQPSKAAGRKDKRKKP
jgi:hypothetical protein